MNDVVPGTAAAFPFAYPTPQDLPRWLRDAFAVSAGAQQFDVLLGVSAAMIDRRSALVLAAAGGAALAVRPVDSGCIDNTEAALRVLRVYDTAPEFAHGEFAGVLLLERFLGARTTSRAAKSAGGAARAAQKACDMFGDELRRAHTAVVLLGEGANTSQTPTELQVALEVIRSRTNLLPDSQYANPMFGNYVDPRLGDEIEVTVTVS